ncbi:MAG: hypothetical protein EOO65_01825 [Methanosarcinales archaeon]|nr:MAG: hypothetical protein EOO65_01825 [Methanosarcinales archaeon]
MRRRRPAAGGSPSQVEFRLALKHFAPHHGSSITGNGVWRATAHLLLAIACVVCAPRGDSVVIGMPASITGENRVIGQRTLQAVAAWRYFRQLAQYVLRNKPSSAGFRDSSGAGSDVHAKITVNCNRTLMRTRA